MVGGHTWRGGHPGRGAAKVPYDVGGEPSQAEQDKEGSLTLPWDTGSRQREGRLTEKRIAKELGAKVHPASGALRIKHDASDETTLYEIKDANKTHTIKAVELLSVWKEAAMAEKEAVYLVKFTNGITLFGVIQKG